jgi:hypothetical protein
MRFPWAMAYLIDIRAFGRTTNYYYTIRVSGGEMRQVAK